MPPVKAQAIAKIAIYTWFKDREVSDEIRAAVEAGVIQLSTDKSLDYTSLRKIEDFPKGLYSAEFVNLTRALDASTFSF